MNDHWRALTSDPVNAALVLVRSGKHEAVSAHQAQTLVETLLASAAQRSAAWPLLLKLLGRWSDSLNSNQATAAPKLRRPLRPWERTQQQLKLQQQQQRRQAQQQQQQEAERTQALLRQALSTVVAGLQDCTTTAAAATTAAVVQPSTAAQELAAVIAPAVSFVASALSALKGDDALDWQQQGAAAACAAVAAAVPNITHKQQRQQHEGLDQLLWALQQLLLSCKKQPSCIEWLLACLLAALERAVPSMLLQQQQLRQQSGSSSSSSKPDHLKHWMQQQAVELTAATTVYDLKSLYLLGQQLGRDLCNAMAAAAAVVQNSSSSSSVDSLHAVTQLLVIACTDGDVTAAAVAGAAAAGMAAGCCDALAAAAAATSAESVWVDTAGHSGSSSSSANQQQQQQQLQPVWMQQIEQHLLLLHRAVITACNKVIQGRSAAEAAATGEEVAAAGSDVIMRYCELLLGYAYSKLMSVHEADLQQQQQQHDDSVPQLSGLLCSLQYILGQCCSMTGVFHHAAAGHAAAANAWLAQQQQQQQHPPHEVGMLARWLANSVTSLHLSDVTLFLGVMRQLSEQLADSYSCYLQAAPAAVMHAVDAAAARQQLDRVFALHVTVLSALWQQQRQAPTSSAAAGVATGPADDSSTAAAADVQAAIVAHGLADLAALQFCQVQLPSYVELLQALVTALAKSGTAADAFLAVALPCYDTLLQNVTGPVPSWLQQQQQQNQTGDVSAGSSGSSSTLHAWLASPMLIAKLSFMLPLLPVACKAATDPAAAVEKCLPLLLLLVPHPIQQVSQAAHSAVAGIMMLAAAAADTSDDQQQQQQQQLVRVAEQAVPLYLLRSLDALPAYGSIEGLAVGFSSIVKGVPAGSTVVLLAVKMVADRAVRLAQLAAESNSSSNTAVQQQQQGAVPGASSVSQVDATNTTDGAAYAAVSRKLLDVIQLAVQYVDFQLLQSVLQLISRAVGSAPVAVKQHWLSSLYTSCLGVDDYVRKPMLVAWIDDLAKHVVGSAILQLPSNAEAQHTHAASSTSEPPFLTA